MNCTQSVSEKLIDLSMNVIGGTSVVGLKGITDSNEIYMGSVHSIRIRLSKIFPLCEYLHCLARAAAAHLTIRLQTAAYRWAMNSAEDVAQVVVSQLNTTHTGRLAIPHAGDWR